MSKILIVLDGETREPAVVTNGPRLEVVVARASDAYRTESLPLADQSEAVRELWDGVFGRSVRFSQIVYCTATIPDSVQLTPSALHEYLDQNDCWPNTNDGD